MTHAELKELLAGYALDALDGHESASLDEHLASCAECREELRSLRETVDAMAEGVPPLAPPERLRARVLRDPQLAPPASHPTPARSAPSMRRLPSPFQALRGVRLWPRPALALAAMAVLLLAATGASLLGQIRQQQELVESRAALALLTSTETENAPLTRVAADLPADAHGHWFHRAGVATQVVVGERLLQAARGEQYVVWMLRPNGWVSAGNLEVDDTGYGRLVILGRDGADVGAIEITLETQTSASPGSRVILRSQPTGS